MDSVRITIAADAAADLAALVKLRTDWIPSSPADDSAPDRPTFDDGFALEFAEWFRQESAAREFWLAWRGNEPIGMVNLMLFDRMPVPGRASGGWGYLCNMFVVEHERNRGVGAQLVAVLLTHADAIGLERVVLKPSPRSIPFYERLGFGAAAQLRVRPLQG